MPTWSLDDVLRYLVKDEAPYLAGYEPSVHLDHYLDESRDEFIYLDVRVPECGGWRVTVTKQAYADEVYYDNVHFRLFDEIMSERKMLEVLNDWPDISWIEEWC